MFSLGLMMVMCCVSSQIMVDVAPQGAAGNLQGGIAQAHHSGRQLHQIDNQILY